jgi:hypothetical protein
LRQADLDGMGGHRGSQPVQRVAIKSLIQDLLDPVGRRHVRRSIRYATSWVPGRLWHAGRVACHRPVICVSAPTVTGTIRAQSPCL